MYDTNGPNGLKIGMQVGNDDTKPRSKFHYNRPLGGGDIRKYGQIFLYISASAGLARERARITR